MTRRRKSTAEKRRTRRGAEKGAFPLTVWILDGGNATLSGPASIAGIREGISAAVPLTPEVSMTPRRQTMSEREVTLADIDFDGLYRAVKQLLAAGMSRLPVHEHQHAGGEREGPPAPEVPNGAVVTYG